jgi:hypothetical protein
MKLVQARSFGRWEQEWPDGMDECSSSLRCLAYSWTEYPSQSHPIDYRCSGIFEVIAQ